MPVEKVAQMSTAAVGIMEHTSICFMVSAGCTEIRLQILPDTAIHLGKKLATTSSSVSISCRQLNLHKRVIIVDDIESG